MEIICGSLMLGELFNFKFYKQLKDFVEKKKYSDTEVDHEWYENYILNELTSDELKMWIRNVFSYNKPAEKNYYYPIELEDIPHKKMIKWASYNLYFKSLWQLSEDQLNHSEHVLSKIEEKLNVKFSTKDDPTIYFLKFGNNKIESSYRPLVLCYTLYWLKDICYFSLRLHGFDFHKIKNSNIVYFQYNNSENRETIIFIHGFGFGIEPYLYYILRLRRKFNLIVLILPNISNMEYCTYMKNINYDKIFPEYCTWRKHIKNIMIKNNISKINFIAHSFGTVILGLLLKDEWILNKTNKKVLMEPVCFVDKSYKIYRYINEPKEGNYNTISKIFNEFVYKDLYLRYVTQRFLYGPEFWIRDYNKLTENSLIVLSEKDQVVPTDEIYEKMKKYNVECIYIKGAYHADMFMTNEYDKTFDYIDNFILK